MCTPQRLELHLKNLKNGPVLYLGLKITRHIIKSQIHLVRLSVYTKFPALQFSVLMEIDEEYIRSTRAKGRSSYKDQEYESALKLTDEI